MLHTLTAGSGEAVDSAGTWLDPDSGAVASATDGTLSSIGNVTILNLSSLHFVKIAQIAWMSSSLHCSAVN